MNSFFLKFHCQIFRILYNSTQKREIMCIYKANCLTHLSNLPLIAISSARFFILFSICDNFMDIRNTLINNTKIITRYTKLTGDIIFNTLVKKYTIPGKILITTITPHTNIQNIESSIFICAFFILRIIYQKLPMEKISNNTLNSNEGDWEYLERKVPSLDTIRHMMYSDSSFLPLSTEDKTIVGAINEVNNQIGILMMRQILLTLRIDHSILLQQRLMSLKNWQWKDLRSWTIQFMPYKILLPLI